MLDPLLEAFPEEMSHGLLLLHPWILNPGLLNNVETDPHLHRVVIDDVLVTIVRVPAHDYDDLALNPGAGKGPSALHLNETSVNRRFVYNLVT
jgi:hypothetical protein